MAVSVPSVSTTDLKQGDPVVDAKGMPTDLFLRTINGNTRNLGRVVRALQEAVFDIQTALDAAGIALDAANAADAKATQGIRETARLSSYTAPTNVLTGTDAGTNATITIANHTRVYPVQGTYDVPDVAIIGGALTGLAYATAYWVYYDDTTLADTTPTYMSTTDSAVATPGAAPGRHFVGYIVTPAMGAPSTVGDGGFPPGGGGGQDVGPI